MNRPRIADTQVEKSEFFWQPLVWLSLVSVDILLIVLYLKLKCYNKVVTEVANKI